MFLFRLAITYEITSELIPNPDYRCTHYECRWSDYTRYVHWGFYLDENGKNITGCAACMAKCDEDELCTSLECGEDQPLLDQTVKKAHCSYWRNESCEKGEEFILHPNNFIYTCIKKKTGISTFMYSKQL